MEEIEYLTVVAEFPERFFFIGCGLNSRIYRIKIITKDKVEFEKFWKNEKTSRASN